MRSKQTACAKAALGVGAAFPHLSGQAHQLVGRVQRDVEVAYRRFVQKRALWGPDAYRFPKKGFGVDQYRERLQRAGVDPDQVTSPFVPTAAGAAPGAAGAQAVATGGGGEPTENPAYYLRLIEELHDNGVLNDAEYDASRLRLLDRLRT